MRISIKSLHYFLTAAERGSISQAAEALNVVPSAVASAIEQVEAEFELKLVQRYPAKGIRPTAAGKALMRKIRHLVEEYDTLMLEGAELRTALSGNLSIGYYAPVAPAFLPSIAGPLVREHPGVSVSFAEVDNERAQTGLLNGDYDLILFVAENVRAGISYETLIEAPPYALLPQDHPLASRAWVEMPDLQGEALVLLDLPVTNEYYRGLIDQAGGEAKIVATASTHEMVRSLVGAGVGCSLLNMLPLAPLTYAGDALAAVPIKSSVKPLRLVLGHLGGKPRRLLQAFMEAALDYFDSEDAQALIVR
ncbi:MAG: LysR family transcriptional regulator [Pseudomonadota bacterium]